MEVAFNLLEHLKCHECCNSIFVDSLFIDFNRKSLPMYGTMIIPTPEILHVPTLRTMYPYIDDNSNLYL